ncbi:MAG: hypothetical protein KJS64_05345 [Acidobacteria bacterium]|nr:hypothetical protein [Acidobacteriota bacterium]
MNHHAEREAERRRHPSALTAARISFAHPSEHVFATLLDVYGVPWLYEPFEFPLAWSEAGDVTRAFRPDFLLPNQNLFVEITVADQRLVTRKNGKIRAFRHLYPEVTLEVVYQRDFFELINRHGLADLNGFAA